MGNSIYRGHLEGLTKKKSSIIWIQRLPIQINGGYQIRIVVQNVDTINIFSKRKVQTKLECGAHVTQIFVHASHVTHIMSLRTIFKND